MDAGKPDPANLQQRAEQWLAAEPMQRTWADCIDIIRDLLEAKAATERSLEAAQDQCASAERELNDERALTYAVEKWTEVLTLLLAAQGTGPQPEQQEDVARAGGAESRSEP